MSYEGRLKIEQIHDTCTGCGSCMNSCPKKCIIMDYDEEGFLFPKIDKDKCIGCKTCEKKCHVLNPLTTGENTHISYYMGWHKDEQVRENSSSGGAFTLFAEYIIKKGGIVFATKYNGDKERLEFSNTDIYSLSEFRKSRYIESNTLQAYSLVRDELDSGRLVLFCGTPCQISGLMAFLKNKEYRNLVTMDFICHGVPSNYFFSQYKRQFEKKNNKICAVDFRYKNFRENKGWHQLYLKMKYNSGREKILPYNCSHYYYYYLQNGFLRKSCYRCNYLSKNISDITIADFWGIIYYKKELDDNKGVSLLMLKNDKVKSIFNEIKNNFVYYDLPKTAVEYALKERNESNYSMGVRESTSELIKKRGYKEYMKLIDNKIMLNQLKYSVRCLIKRK